MKLKALTLALLFSACQTTGTKEVIEQYEKIEGITVLVFQEHDRLIIYLNNNNRIILCHAYNNNNKSLLKRIETLTSKSGTQISLYGQQVEKVEEYLSGVDFIANTIEYTDPVKGEKVFVDLNYGDRIKDAFSFKTLVKKGVESLASKAWSMAKP